MGVARMTTTGFELEVSYGHRNVIDGLRSIGMTDYTRLHGYHCGCENCQPRPWFGPQQKWFKAQSDCTADGEFISGIFDYGSEALDHAIAGLGHVLLRAAGCDTNGSVGNHVHVGREVLDNSAGAMLRLVRLFGRYAFDLQEIAAANRHNMRTYNGHIGIPAATDELWTATDDGNGGRYYPEDLLRTTGHTLAIKSRTVEFRLWNSTKAPWRIRTHVGLSNAFV